MTGIVVSFNPSKGYGFLQPLVGDGPNATAVYFHASAVCRPKDGTEPALPRGCEVAFDLVRGNKGPQAANVHLVPLNGRVLREKKQGENK